MSRSPTEPVFIRPQNNIYTVLVIAGTVVVALGLLALFLRANEVFPGGLFGS